jgi:hypothetical protein
MRSAHWLSRLRGRSRASRAEPHRHNPLRQRLWLERLEDRTLPSIVNLGPLQFNGPFVQAGGSGEYSANGETELGLKPTQSEPFKALLAFNGLVTIPSPTDPNQSGFTAEGKLSLFILDKTSTGNQTVIWDNTDGQIFTVAALTGVGQQLAPNTGTVAQDFKVAQVPFQVDTVRLDMNGDTTAKARVGLQGDLDFTSLGLTGLTAGVSGVNYALVDENGATLTGVNASISSSFAFAGVSFKGSLGMTYAPTGNVFGMTGSVTITTPDNGLKNFQITLNQLTVTGGDVTALHATLNGTIQGNAIWGMQINPKNLTFDFDFTNHHFLMFGGLSVAVAGDPGAPSESITATMGTQADPGLVTDLSGHVIDVNMSLSGSFSLFGLKLQIPAANPVTLVYHADESDYLISGTISAPALFNATVGLGTAAQPGLVIHDGRFSVNAFSLGLSDVPLGGFKLRQLIVAYSQTAEKTTFAMTVAVEFPQHWEVTGRIIFVNNAISEIALKYEATGDSSRIPIGDTGLYLTEMDATVQNLDNIQNVVVSGHLEVEYGRTVTIFGSKCSFFRAEGGFTVDADHLMLEATVWLGAKKDGSSTTGVLGSGHGELNLDWNDQKYLLTLHASLCGGVYTFDGTFYMNGAYQVWVSASASVNVPSSIPLIGGEHLGSMDFRLAYDPNDSSTQYVAAWVTINLLFTHVSVGLEYKFDKNSVIPIGNSTINAISGNPFEQNQVTTYSESFDVPAGATSAVFSVNFPANSGSQTVTITPPGGTEIEEENFNTSNGISLLSSLNTATSYNVSIVNPSNKTDPPSVPLPAGHYVMKLKSTNFKFPDPTVPIASILNDGNGNTKITFGSRPDGLQVGNTIAVSGSTFTTGGAADAYNIDQVITSISPDGMSIVTDQQYVGQAFGGTAEGWQQPEFSASFNYLPPSITLASLPAIISSPVLNVPLSGVVDSAFSTTTTVNLYLDTTNAGYNGVLLQGKVPLTFTKDGNGKPTGQYQATAQGDLSNLPAGTYYIYAVINDGTNTPVYSLYSSGFVPQHAVDGTVMNQLSEPQAGWRVFADLHGDGKLEPDDPVSQPSTSTGEFHLSSNQPLPVNSPFKLVLVNPYPTNFDFGADGGVESVTYNGSTPATVNFSVNEKSTIRGNVFADLSRDGQRVGQPLLFDFGTPASPVAPGYTQVTATTTYTAARGFGWTSGKIDDLNRGTGDPLTQDANYTTDGTFAVDLPAGTYNVTLTLGDTGPYLHDDVGIFLQGAQVDTVTTAASQLVNRTYANIVVSNGQLMLHLRDLGGSDVYAVIEGMQIVRAGDPPLAGWTVRLLDTSGATVATTATRSDGTYSFSQLAPGTYQVVLSLWNGAAASYDFDTVTGTAVPDTANAPNVHDGTLVNGAAVGTAAAFGIDPPPVSSASNDILHLDGSNQFVDVMHSSNLEPGTGAFSVAGWVRFDNVRSIQTIAGSLDSAAGGGWAFELVPHSTGIAAQQTFAAGTYPGPVAVADLNGDGKPDLIIASTTYGYLSVLANTTAPGATIASFAAPQTISLRSAPQAVAVGDFNGDGKPDLAVLGSDGNVWVYLNTTAPGARTVSLAPPVSFAAGSNPTSLAVGDFNGDGKPDLAIANGVTGASLSVLLNTTAPGALVPSFTNRVSFAAGSYPAAIVVGDFNGDGKPDLAVANSISNGTVSVLLNTTAPGALVPSFTNSVSFAVGSYPQSVAVGDFNGDGKPDLAVVNPSAKTVSVLVNTTARGAMLPTFAPSVSFAAGSSPQRLAVGDFNNDGKPDIAVVNFGANYNSSGTVAMFLNTTAPGATVPSFTPSTTFATGANPSYLATGDFNADGAPDLVTSNYYSNNVSVMLSAVDGASLRVTLAENPSEGTGLLLVQDSTTVLKSNTWYHVAFTYDPAADDNGDGSHVGTVKLYMDGALVATATGLGSLPDFPDLASASGVSFNVGNAGGDAAQAPFGGYLDAISVWDSALTPLQVETLAGGATSPSYQFGLLPVSGTYTATINDKYQLVEHQDFGVFQNQAVAGTIRGNSLNSSGLLNPNAQPLAGWTVTARDENGNVVATTVSEADGRYLFPSLPTGTYKIAETVSAGWKQTSPLAPVLQFANPVSYALPAGAAAAVAGDFDNDGIMDLAVAFLSKNYLRVYWGHGGGIFSPSDYSQYSLSFGNPALPPVVVDVAGNGSKSLVVIDASGGVTLLRNMRSSGASRSNLFSTQQIDNWHLPANARPVGVATGDFDRDGKTDMVVSYQGLTTSDPAGFIFLPGSLAKATNYILGVGNSVGGIAVGYFNNDSYLDAVIDGGADVSHITIAYGDGKGGFSPIQKIPGTGTIEGLQVGGAISAGDINGNGRDDIAWASHLYSQAAVVGFFQDAASSSFQQQPNGFGVFTGDSSLLGSQILVDLNGDLKPDLARLSSPSSSAGGIQTIRVLTNNSTGSAAFNDGQLIYSTNQNAIGLTAADLNGDGLPDLILTTSNGLLVFLNQSTSQPQISVTLASGPGSSGNDFTNGQVAPLYGTVYDDANGNGVRDPGETGRAGVKVYLDLVGNGVFDPTRDPWTTTDAAGTYAFADPPDGSYAIRTVPEPGRVLTDRGDGSQLVTVLNGIASHLGSQNFATALALVNPIPAITLLEGAPFSVSVTPSAAGAGGVLTFTLDPGAPAAASINPATGMFTWKPTGAEGPGVYPITVRVTDAALAGRTEAIPLTITVDPSPVYQYVRALYRDLLDREADPSGLLSWVTLIESGSSRAVVATDIWNSPEHRGIEVDGFYQTYLHRAADPAGRLGWIDAMLVGMSETAVAQAFLTSPEYTSTHPSSAAFLDRLYTDVLGRAPDDAGFIAWHQAAAQGASRAQLAEGFLTSEEADRNLLDRYYHVYLGRQPDPAGQAGWLALLETGSSSSAAVGQAILASDEFFARALAS